jgi:chitinase
MFVVEWRNVRFYDNADQRLSFELVLGEDGSVAFNYRDVELEPLERGTSATIGIESGGGTSAVQVSNGQAALTGDNSVLFRNRQSLLSIGDASVVEGASKSRSARFAVSLSEPANNDVSALYTTLGADATAGVDYTSRSGTITIPAGASSASISIPVRGDAAVEPKESFSVWLHDPTGGQLGRAVGVGRILNDDPTSGLRVAIGDGSVVEGRRGSRAVRMTISLSTSSTSSVSVAYGTADSTAIAHSDYAAKSGHITIPAGETSVVVSITVHPDALIEGDESFIVRISAPVRAVIGRATGAAKIFNDD